MSATSAKNFNWRGYTPAKLPEVPSWVETFGRAGHIAKGVVYMIIGFLAFQLAIGSGGETAGAKDAIREIGEQAYGQILLAITALGLFSYTAWRFIQAWLDTEGAGTDAKGLVKRTGYTISGISYLLLGLFAGSLAIGSSSSSGNSGNGGSVLLDSVAGRMVLGVAGGIVIATGIYFVIKGYKAKFMEKYNLTEMSDRFRTTALHAGRIGLITRGIAFGIIGWFLVSSAWNASGGEISGMEEALGAIAAQSYGKILIGITGFGLMAYAVHMILLGWYRRFNVQ